MGPKSIEHLWHPLNSPGDANLWQNVEMVNKLLIF